ncbi:SUMF1/EgtB/PvdO family nonheme iron enzyme [Actinoplanes sp. NPDC049265]|uniref:SUMF1/EgtB/PvdO family nonheme iron enzyme n=1 Tax=Actinoplanes sp. NPDC049265 TaxID=3363902 RepID=UPI003722A11D
MRSAPAAFKALVIGNGVFPEDPYRLNALNGPRNDVEAVRSALSDADHGMFECLPPLKDANAREILTAAEDFFGQAAPDDCLLYYYSGHGQLDLAGDFYFCANDTDSGSLTSPRVTGDDLRKLVEMSPAALKIIIMDCCYATRFKAGLQPPGFIRGQGRFVLAATRGSGVPLVPDAATPADLSPFTAMLVEALQRDDLDADQDGFITAADVSAFISRTARSAPSAPFALDRWDGTGMVPIARSRYSAPPRPAPPAVVAARPSAAPPGDTPAGPAPSGERPQLMPIPPQGPPRFFLSRDLVTHGQFHAFLSDPANAGWRPDHARSSVGAVDENYLRHWDGLTFPAEWRNRPVVAVSAAAANAYALWAGRRTGLALRLPDAVEWEEAATAGRSGDWVNEDILAGRVNCRPTLGRPSAIGDVAPGPNGLRDLLGNAWEICVDAAGLPVLRGGAYHTPHSELLEHWALASAAECRPDTGFRLACDRSQDD